jgi:hypothetical protein
MPRAGRCRDMCERDVLLAACDRGLHYLREGFVHALKLALAVDGLPIVGCQRRLRLAKALAEAAPPVLDGLNDRALDFWELLLASGAYALTDSGRAALTATLEDAGLK